MNYAGQVWKLLPPMQALPSVEHDLWTIAPQPRNVEELNLQRNKPHITFAVAIRLQ
jgi:hypothetical protein